MKKLSTLSQLFLATAPPLLAALLLAAPPCQAEDAPRIPKQRENRFLFIVDTSSAMRGCSNAVVQDVVELMESEMRGEFRQGDTVGLWTYNDKLHPEFPMQVWTKADKDTIVADMAAFLQERRYGKRAHLEKVMPAMSRVIKNSERITVLLISDGTGSIQGTPFDKDINNLQKKYAPELRSAHVPFVTVLAARNGAVFDYTLNYPGLVAIPHTANPEIPAETNAPVAAAISNPAANAPAKPRPMRSIIMSAATNVVHAAAPRRPLWRLRLPRPRRSRLRHWLSRLFPRRRPSLLLRPRPRADRPMPPLRRPRAKLRLRKPGPLRRPSWRGRIRNQPTRLPCLMRRR